MNDIHVKRLSKADASVLSRLLTADDNDYRKFFIPFASDIKSLEKRLESARDVHYWGKNYMLGLFMMRGFDEGYQRPSLGGYVAQAYSGKALSRFALDYSMNWCLVNNIGAMMLKVHPDNH
jgi:hypothetical protein